MNRFIFPFILLIFFTLCINITAQNNIVLNIDSINNRIISQLTLFPQEKIYVQTDKSQYISGEKIWFRIHLVDAAFHQQVIVSKYAYVELINPLDSIVSRIKTKIDDNGIHSGYLHLAEDFPAGEYTLQAYTHYMNNLDKDYFFKKKIHINDPSLSSIQPHISFEYESENKVKAKISFYDNTGDTLFIPENIKISLNNRILRKLKFNEEKTSITYINLDKKSDNNIINIEFIKDKRLCKYQIPVPGSDFDVAFFPEGGYLLEGINSNIAFKAINKNGISEYISGEVFDDEDNFVTDLKTLHTGMGLFTFIPQKDKRYYAICKNTQNIEKRIELPSVVDNTYTLKTVWKEDNLLISVNKPSSIYKTIPLNILIHCRGQLQYLSEWKFSDEFLTLSKNMFSTGVLQILLIDNDLNIISERLVFCKNDNQAKIRFRTDKINYSKRQKVSAMIDLRDSENKHVSGNFSVSVTDNQDLLPDTTNNILTTLLLTSDLKGYIENPGFYFEPNNRLASKALDLLMMIHGWRRYDISKTLISNYQTPHILFGEDAQVKGYVKSYWRGKPVENSNVSIFCLDNSYFDMTSTDTNGKFNFGDIEYPDSIKLVIQALNQKGKDKVQLEIEEDTFPIKGKHLPFDKHINTDSHHYIQNNTLEDYIKKADLKYTYENGNRMIYLNEVKVTATQKNKQNSIYEKYSAYQFTKEKIDRAIDIGVLLTETPGLYIKEHKKDREPLKRRVYLRNPISLAHKPYPAIIIVNDIIMNPEFTIDDIPLSDIKQIDVLKGPRAAILGSDAMEGAIVITTKNGPNNMEEIAKYNIKTISPLGFQKPIEFYSPKYETKKQINDKTPDLRTTIFWKPDVIVSEKGEASFEFYTADSEKTNYSVVIEGVTDAGEIIYTIENISIK